MNSTNTGAYSITLNPQDLKISLIEKVLHRVCYCDRDSDQDYEHCKSNYYEGYDYDYYCYDYHDDYNDADDDDYDDDYNNDADADDDDS